MWSHNDHQMVILPPGKGFSTPSSASLSHLNSSRCPTPMSETKRRSPAKGRDLFHVIHKVPAGDSPYVRAKQVQLIEKDPSRAISLFWSAINAGDRVDSALKDMAIVMKQLNRPDEAIEAIKSFRHLCPHDSQESLDNVLVELYKRAGRIEEEVEMLQNKLKRIEEGVAFGGRRTKTARSQGKKVHITIEEEKSRILGNLAWAYLQQNNYSTAAEYYRRALVFEPDKNKQCNLAICLMHLNRTAEAKSLLQAVKASCGRNLMDESFSKSFERACEILTELESGSTLEPFMKEGNSCEERRSSPKPVAAPRTRDDTDRDIRQRRESYCVDHLKTKPKCLRYSQQNDTVHESRNGCFDENSCDQQRSGFFESKKHQTGRCVIKSQATSWHSKTRYSPASPAWGKTRMPFTQPRRRSWGFSDAPEQNFSCNEDWRIKSSWEHSDPKKIAPEERNLMNPAESQRLESNARTLNPTANSSTGCKKKSWADMAEEEEREEEMRGTARFDFNERQCSQNFEYYNGWNEEEEGEEEELNDENRNCNVVHESPYLQTQMRNVARKLELFNLRDEEYVSPVSRDAAVSRNQPLKRALCFDHHQKRNNSVDYSSNLGASPVPRKSLNCDAPNPAQGKGKDPFPGKNVRLLRRNRLKVFEDITRSP